METVFNSPTGNEPDAKRTKTDDALKIASLVKCDAKLDGLGAKYTGTPFFRAVLPHSGEVIAYAKECLRKIQAGNVNPILQFKCPVPEKNATGATISLALGGNCPDESRLRICTVRCADQLFGGKENLKKYFIFNCRVECRIDPKTGRCAVCSPWEACFLGEVYEVMCEHAFAIGAKMTYISVAGTSTGIKESLGNHYLKDKKHPDGSQYFQDSQYLPSGYHLSLLSYYCDKMGTVEEQTRKITSMVQYISVALGDPDMFTNALANPYLPFVVNWDIMSPEEKDEMLDFWGALEGGHPLGNYAYLFKIGIFLPEYVHLRIMWSRKGGENCYELGHGIFDPNHPVLLKAGVKNWGEWCSKEGKGLFDPANAAAGRIKGGKISGHNHAANGTAAPGLRQALSKTLREKMIIYLKVNKCSPFPAGHELKIYAKKKRQKYCAMIVRVTGRKLDRENPIYSSDEVSRIIAGVEADDELKVLSDNGFCFIPPHIASSQETLCGCAHITKKHKRGGSYGGYAYVTTCLSCN